MRGVHHFCGFALLALVSAGAVAADTGSLGPKQQAQERARALTGELVAGVLDIQLRQLQENGLDNLPIYRDIASMRGNLEGLMNGDMAEIVQLLAAAQSGKPEVRLAKFNEARGKVREVVVRLMAERQRLNRRMGIARLAGDVRQLMNLQAKTLQSTTGLSQLRPDEREQSALATIEDQADVHKLYLQLVETLQDVSGWGADIGAGASDGLRIVKAAQVEPELVAAGQALAKADTSQAAKSQQAVLKGLAALLEKLEEAQGLIHSDRAEALRLVQQLRVRQQELRERTRSTELNDGTADPLIEGQTSFQKDLAKLAAGMTRFGTTEPLFEAAKAASFEATAQLFEGKKQSAVDEQGRVISLLTQVEKVLEQGIDADRAGKSADELADLVHRLKQLAKEMATARERQLEVNKSAADSPGQGAKLEQEVADLLAKTDGLSDLSSAVTAKLNDAKERVAAALAGLGNVEPSSAGLRASLTAAALAAIEQAQSEIAVQLADTERRQKAVEVGELARAAEAIERAAAAELTVAKVAEEAARARGLAAEEATALVREQEDIALVAERIATGVQKTAPRASSLLTQLEPFVEGAARGLYAAQRQPGPASRTSAQQTGELARKAGDQLTQAATELRRAARESAQMLAEIAGKQFSVADAARQAVADLAAQSLSTESETVSQVLEAARKIQEAIAAQAQAAGKGEEAAARQLAGKISESLAKQDDADRAAEDLQTGRASGPLAAASAQQEVADLAGQIGRQASGDAANLLRRAATSAGEAARDTLGGQPAQATGARKQTRQALEEALQAAQEQIAALAAAQPQGLDPKAQGRAAELAREAQQMLQRSALEDVDGKIAAAQSLVAATEQAAATGRSIDAGDQAQARKAQDGVHRALASAAENLDQAVSELTAKQAAKLAEQSRQARRLVAQAQGVDPGAAAALNQAQLAGDLPAEVRRPAPLATAQHQAARSLSRAEANLAARGEQLRHDRDLGQTLDQLTQDQQTSREAIARAAATLAKTSSEGNQPAPAVTPEQLLAAQALRQAQQQFATALRATGEGTVEASGQTEVVNQPIREGLEIASRLNQLEDGAAASTEQSLEDAQQAAASQPASKGQPLSQQPTEGQPGKSQPPNSSQQGSQPPSPSGQQPPNSLGSGLVPPSPEATAQQIAGAEANAAATAAMSSLAAQGEGESDQPGQGEGQSKSKQPGDASSTVKKGGATKSGKAKTNQEEQPGDLEVADAAKADSPSESGVAGQDAAAPGSGVEGEAWFAKLPPSLRSAIQAKSRGKAPRGYEERLRRYFESVD